MFTLAKGALKGVSIKEIGAEIQRTDSQGRVNKNSPSIVEGLKPKKRTFNEGYHVLSPDELLALLVPRQQVSDGKIHGFQRPKITKPHIRKIAQAVEQGKPMPTIEIAHYRNAYWVVDGQHRALAGVLARQNMPALVRKFGAEEMQELFASQGKGRKVNPSTLVLSANDDFSRYVQDAVVNNKNPWNKLVSSAVSSQKKLTPKQMFDSVGHYVSNTVGSHVARHIENYSFDKDKADEMAMLVSAFGNKKTNPNAFRPVAIKAITYASVLIIRRTGSRKADIDRWVNWMPLFPWDEYMSIRRSKELATILIRHWNKRLAKDNRVKLPEELL